MIFIHRDAVAVLTDDALSHLVERVNSPLADRAFLVRPTQLRHEPLLPHDRAAALPARLAVEVLAALADGESAGDLLFARLGHPGGDVASGRCGEVAGFNGLLLQPC